MSAETPPPRRRTSLATVRGGPVSTGGEPAVARGLALALDVPGDAELDYTHGFHTWPARFHPLLVRRLLAGTPRGARVLDPFVGSGTTLVEAAVAGLAGFGVDVNPLAIELARLKATPWPATKRRALVDAGEAVAARVLDEGKAARRAGAKTAPPRRETRFDDPKWYAPHVYRELVALRLAIDDVRDERIVRALRLVLSSIVVKVSRQRSDTDPTLVERAVPRGGPARHFARRLVELDARMAAFAAAVPPGTARADARLGDARKLDHLDDESIDVVVTSPPYLGTYDYVGHHARRFGWVGLDPRPLVVGEIGARRTSVEPARARDRYERELGACLDEMRRVLRPGGLAFVLVGDSMVAGERVAGDVELERIARGAGLAFVARASQERRLGKTPDEKPRREHLVALRVE